MFWKCFYVQDVVLIDWSEWGYARGVFNSVFMLIPPITFLIITNKMHIYPCPKTGVHVYMIFVETWGIYWYSVSPYLVSVQIDVRKKSLFFNLQCYVSLSSIVNDSVPSVPSPVENLVSLRGEMGKEGGNGHEGENRSGGEDWGSILSVPPVESLVIGRGETGEEGEDWGGGGKTGEEGEGKNRSEGENWGSILSVPPVESLVIGRGKLGRRGKTGEEGGKLGRRGRGKIEVKGKTGVRYYQFNL